MPEYLAPGVFVEETSFRSKSIEGVSTSVAAIVGPTRYGPLRGRPEAVTSFGEFRRTFGDDRPLSLAGVDVENYTAHAARAFFDNGGKQLFVVRTARALNEFPGANPGLPVAAAFASAHNGAVRFSARHPGGYGNLWLEVRWRGAEELLQVETVPRPDDGDAVLVQAPAVPSDRITAPAPGLPAGFPAVVALLGAATQRVSPGGARTLEVDTANAVVLDTTDLSEVAGLPATLTVDLDPPAAPARPLADVLLQRATVRRPAGSAPGTRFPVLLDLRGNAPGAITRVIGRNIGVNRSPRLLVGDSDGATVRFTAAANTLFDAINPPAGAGATLANDLTVPAALLAAPPAAAVSLTAQPNRFDVDVHVGAADGEVVFTFANIAVDPREARNLATALPQDPERTADRRDMPVFATLDLDAIAAAQRPAALLQELWFSFEANHLGADQPRFLVPLSGGSDGDAPVEVDYAGEPDEQNGSTGLCALEEVEDVSIVMTPAAAADAGNHQGIVNAVVSHCRRMRYRVGIVDSREGMSINEVRTFRNQFSDDRLALYYPWVVVPDPNRAGSELYLPPAGFIAGTYARTDVDRGVHKAPANETVFGALRFEIAINKFQQELLNPEGVNCLRSFPRLGHRVWGGRTLSADPEWRYVNVRRYFLFLERSIDKSTQWVVFEPNGEQLWGNARDTVEGFLFNEWKERHLLGSTPKEAYFVRCDRTTMTQNDLDNGRLVCLVGVAPLRPAEFVIFRIGQKTADA